MLFEALMCFMCSVSSKKNACKYLFYRRLADLLCAPHLHNIEPVNDHFEAHL
jgi:hypothetical protein